MAGIFPAASLSRAFHLLLSLSFLLLLLFYVRAHLHSSYPTLQQSRKSISRNTLLSVKELGCDNLHRYGGSEAKCTFLTSSSQCSAEGYIDYFLLFYCICGKTPIIGYTLLILWLVLLFYLLGNTAAMYFSSSLEGLSQLLKLSPSIAGVTLLSLGNGAPDIFSSVVSFTGSSTNFLGLNSVLGAAFFVSTVVMGIISICVSSHKICIHKSSFIRDICFLLFVLSTLSVILVFENINVWSAIAFSSLYPVYIFLVSITDHFHKTNGRSLLPTKEMLCSIEYGNLRAPFLGTAELGDPNSLVKLAICSDEPKAGKSCYKLSASACFYFDRILYFLQLPLYLPRRLTIPDVCEERWCKPFAVISVVLAPIVCSIILNSKREEVGSDESFMIYCIAGFAGLILGIVALLKTNKSTPPRRFLLPWLAGGFLMSMLWTYIIAGELVALLLSFGTILEISPSVLGVTVLAWGNCLGDLFSNMAVAVNGGPGGVQVAMSGCYAGPVFSILVGLGISFSLCSWNKYPYAFVIPKDPSLIQTIGFLIGGLLWSLVILLSRGMKLDKFLGCGLLSIYLCFLSIRLAQSLGLVEL